MLVFFFIFFVFHFHFYIYSLCHIHIKNEKSTHKSFAVCCCFHITIAFSPIYHNPNNIGRFCYCIFISFYSWQLSYFLIVNISLPQLLKANRWMYIRICYLCGKKTTEKPFWKWKCCNIVMKFIWINMFEDVFTLLHTQAIILTMP